MSEEKNLSLADTFSLRSRPEGSDLDALQQKVSDVQSELVALKAELASVPNASARVDAILRKLGE
jgi:hypothetical protein